MSSIASDLSIFDHTLSRFFYPASEASDAWLDLSVIRDDFPTFVPVRNIIPFFTIKIMYQQVHMVPSEYLFPDDHTLSEKNVNCSESGTSCFF